MAEPVVISSRRSGKTAALKSLELRDLTQDPAPPLRLSIDPNSPDFHPSYTRVGVRVDGKERNDLQFYDVQSLAYMTTDRTSHLAESIEPYWRFIESRQQRRARLRWEEKHK